VDKDPGQTQRLLRRRGLDRPNGHAGFCARRRLRPRRQLRLLRAHHVRVHQSRPPRPFDPAIGNQLRDIPFPAATRRQARRALGDAAAGRPRRISRVHKPAATRRVEGTRSGWAGGRASTDPTVKPHPRVAAFTTPGWAPLHVSTVPGLVVTDRHSAQRTDKCPVPNSSRERWAPAIDVVKYLPPAPG